MKKYNYFIAYQLVIGKYDRGTGSTNIGTDEPISDFKTVLALQEHIRKDIAPQFPDVVPETIGVLITNWILLNAN